MSSTSTPSPSRSGWRSPASRGGPASHTCTRRNSRRTPSFAEPWRLRCCSRVPSWRTAPTASRSSPASTPPSEIAGSAVPGNDGVVRALHELADEPSLRNAVHFLGYRDVVWQVLADCDVLVVPSRMEEGFGNTAVEGALAARPVVVSDTSGLREASAGFASMQRVQPGDAAALRDALGAVIEDWPRFRALAADDRSVALRRHDPARYRTSIATAAATVRGPLVLSSAPRPSASWDPPHGRVPAAASDMD